MKTSDGADSPKSSKTLQDQASGESVRTATFVPFFRENYPRLVSTMRLAGALGSAEDLTQEAFAIVLTHWNSANASGSPEGYLFRCAFRLLAREFKTRKLPREHFVDASSVSTSDSFEETVCALDELTILVDKLPPRARACSVAYFALGMSTEEIANSLNITAGTVRKHLSDARASLRHGYYATQQDCPVVSEYQDVHRSQNGK